MAQGKAAKHAELENAIQAAAKKIAEAKTPEEAAQWQGIVNQNQAILDAERND